MNRNEAIERIRKALKARSGKTWSVTGGRGTAWGWISVNAPPTRRTWKHYLPTGLPDRPESYQEHEEPGCQYGHMSPKERAELAALMGLPSPVHLQGLSIPASGDYYQEHVDRAEGRQPSVIGKQYWD